MDVLQELRERQAIAARRGSFPLTGEDIKRYADEVERLTRRASDLEDADLEVSALERTNGDLRAELDAAQTRIAGMHDDNTLDISRAAGVARDREQLAALVRSGRHCETGADHKQGMCGCEDLAAAILRGDS